MKMHDASSLIIGSVALQQTCGEPFREDVNVRCLETDGSVDE
jgi:hypothetical protein